MSQLTPIRGFAHTPVLRACCYATLFVPLVALVTSCKYLFLLLVDPGLWVWRQWWRLATFQVACTLELDVLLALVAWYHFKVVERAVGSRKYTRLLLWAYVLNMAVTGGAMVTGMYTWGVFNSVASGPVGMVWAVTAYYSAHIPSMYRFAVNLTSQENPHKVMVSDKAFVWVFAVGLAVNNGWRSLGAASVGYAIGLLLASGLLPLVERELPGTKWVMAMRTTAEVTSPRDASPASDDEDPAEPPRPLRTQLANTFM